MKELPSHLEEAYKGWKEHYYDYAYDNVMFRNTDGNKQRFAKRYGSDSEYELERDSDYFDRARIHYGAVEITKEEYWKGKPKPAPRPPPSASRVFSRRQSLQPLQNVIYFETSGGIHEFADGIGFEVQRRIGLQAPDWVFEAGPLKARLVEFGSDRALGIAKRWIAGGFVFFSADRTVDKSYHEVEKLGLRPETYVEYMRYVRRAMDLPEVTKGLFLVDREPALWWEQTERGLEVTLTTDGELLSTIAGKVIRSELRQRQIPHETGIFPSLDA